MRRVFKSKNRYYDLLKTPKKCSRDGRSTVRRNAKERGGRKDCGRDLTFQANDLQGARAGWGRGALAGETPHDLFQIVKSPPHSQDSDTQQPNE